MPMSLESAMDEERREVMNILEGRPIGFGRSSVPEPIRTASPAAPVRSMLDVGPVPASAGLPGPPRPRSIAGTAAGITGLEAPLHSAPLRSSMLEPYSPPASRTGSAESSTIAAGAQPTVTSLGSGADGASQPMSIPIHHARSAPSQAAGSAASSVTSHLPYSGNQFDMTSSLSGPSQPKRASQGSRSHRSSGGNESDLPPPRFQDRKRHNSAGAALNKRSSHSPSSRRNRRSDSPGTRLLNTNSFNPMPMPGKFVSDSGKVIDLKNAYRKLSDFNLLQAGSGAAPTQSSATRARLNSGETLGPSGQLRLAKDYYDRDAGEEAIESSDEAHSSDEEAWGARGRPRGRDEDNTDPATPRTPQSANLSGDALYGQRKQPKSLLAAAEEERIDISNKYNVRSLLDPVVTVTGPGGEKIASRKTGVHPNTNYNAQTPRDGTPEASDSDDMHDDILRAQRLSIRMSHIDTSRPYCAIRTIIRGDFTSLQQDGRDGYRRLRSYLVATDLSAEAAYALEWTIGTVIRDGDTLLAVYAIEGGDAVDKPATQADESAGEGVGVGEGASAMAESAATIGRLTESARLSPPQRYSLGTGLVGAGSVGAASGSLGNLAHSNASTASNMASTTDGAGAAFESGPSASASALGSTPSAANPGSSAADPSKSTATVMSAPEASKTSRSASLDPRNTTKLGLERLKAIEDITQTCLRLLRKTKLQVRIAIEVIHCKSPRSLITEAIDVVEPTLVVLGSRGRSALKGVLLGSFSNYLVMKSSVPVMVARKKLKKPSSKGALPRVRLANNLTPVRRLEDAKID